MNIMSEKYRLTTDIMGNCGIRSEDSNFGLFNKMDKDQVIRVIAKLNEMDIEIQDLITKNEDLEYELIHLQEKYEKLLEDRTRLINYLRREKGFSYEEIKEDILSKDYYGSDWLEVEEND